MQAKFITEEESSNKIFKTIKKQAEQSFVSPRERYKKKQRRCMWSLYSNLLFIRSSFCNKLKMHKLIPEIS